MKLKEIYGPKYQKKSQNIKLDKIENLPVISNFELQSIKEVPLLQKKITLRPLNIE